jgi:6-phosphogluconolactonase
MTDAPDGNKNGVYDCDAERTNLPSYLILPAQAGFNPSGDVLMGPENGSSEVHVLTVGLANLARAPWVTPISHGCTRVSFAFNLRGHLIITEPSWNGAAGDSHPSIVSFHTIATGESLEAISASMPNFPTATCWIVIGKNGHFSYTINNGSNTITGRHIGDCGSFNLLNADGIRAVSNIAPVDMAMTGNGRFLSSVNAWSGTVAMFWIDKLNSSLTALAEIGGFPVSNSAGGMAACSSADFWPRACHDWRRTLAPK